MVQAFGDFKDNQAASESAAIAGALSHLIKVANGQIPMNMFYSKNQDNSAYAKKGLQAFGIDTSRPFTINGRTFHFDGDEQIRMGSGQHVDEEYQITTVPEEFAGMSFWDLINSGKGKAIPTVNKIVNAKNPDDGKIYLTFFTEDRITCYEPGGEKTWELEISNEEKVGKIKKFFENYTPDRTYVKEYYSNESLGIVASKDFWERYLERDSVKDSSEKIHEQSEELLDEIIDYNEILRQKISEIFVKIQNGDTEPTYQIGAQSFTEKEWEEFLEKFDSIEEAIQELIKEEQAKKEAEETKPENELAGTVNAGNGLPGNKTSIYDRGGCRDIKRTVSGNRRAMA